MVPDDQHHKLTLPNKVGNTILHEASTSNKLVHAAVEMLNKAPELLNMRNKAGVTPLYRSVQFGRMKMFRFLDEQSRQRMQQTTFREVYYNDKNKTTVLHAAVVNGSFDLALLIAEKYKRLVNEKDNNKMTALQLLACNSLAFEGRGSGRYLKRPKCLKCSRDLTEEMSFDRKGVLTDDVSSDSEAKSTEDMTQKKAGCWRVPYWEEIQKERKRYESALKLTKFLIKEDRSWKETKALENQNDPTYHTFDPSLQSSPSLSEKEENKTEIPDKPLILATKYGYVEMVEEILKEYPWAVEYVDQQGRTILHVAIKYRQIKVLDRVEQMGVLKRLGRKVDNKSNTILHMVGEKTEDHIVRQVRGPAFELQENLLLFERVRKMCPSSLRNTLNDDNKTAQKLFEDTNEPLRVTANEWLKQTAQNCSRGGAHCHRGLCCSLHNTRRFQPKRFPNPPQPTFLCRFHHDRCPFPYVCSDFSDNIPSNSYIPVSLRRFQAASSTNANARYYVSDSISDNDDGCICCDCNPHDTQPGGVDKNCPIHCFIPPCLHLCGVLLATLFKSRENFQLLTRQSGHDLSQIQ